MTPYRVVLVPGALALDPRHSSLEDPIPELRAAVRTAVDWAAAMPPVSYVGTDQGRAVIRAFQGDAFAEGSAADVDGSRVFIANGSAKRTEQAPGYFDPRAATFDDELREALTVEPWALASVDRELAAELWADVEVLPALGRALTESGRAELVSVDYDDAPYGVKYWVIRWEVSDGE